MNSKDFLKEGFVEDAHMMHQDHEVQMAREECYHAAENAIVLHKLLRNVSEQQGLEGWVAAKITLAGDYLKTVREYLEYELMSAPSQEPMLPVAEGAAQDRLDELSPNTLSKYVNKAVDDVADRSHNTGVQKGARIATQAFAGGSKEPRKFEKDPKIANRKVGISRAMGKLEEEGVGEGILSKSQVPVSYRPGDNRITINTGLLGAMGIGPLKSHDLMDKKANELADTLKSQGFDAEAWGQSGSGGATPWVYVEFKSDEDAARAMQLISSGKVPGFKKAGFGQKFSEQGMAEGTGNYRRNSFYNPMDYEREQQRQMDYEKRDFKRQELQHELGHEDTPEFQAMMRNQDRGPWYLKIDGKILKSKGEMKVFDWRKGANNYALAIIKNKPELQGKIFLTKNPKDEQGLTEMSAGSVATVVNPTPKNKAKVGTLFGGTYKQKKTK
jgi:hypothetical protein